MKNLYAIIILLLLVLPSCNSFDVKFNKKLKDFVGEWQLVQMTYTNEKGELIDIENFSSSIVFSDISPVEGNFSRNGTLVIEEDSINFIFDLSPTSETINFDINENSLVEKPVYTIGKVYQYNYEMIDKNELVFTTDFEIVYPTNEELTNPVYVFERK